MQSRGSSVLGLILAVAVSLPVTARAQADVCSPESLETWFREYTPLFREVVSVAKGMVAVFGDGTAESALVVWFGWLPNRDLTTSQRLRGAFPPEERARWDTFLNQLTQDLEARHELEDCENLRVETTTHPVLDLVHRHAASTTISHPVWTAVFMNALMKGAILLAWILYIGLVLFLVVRSLVRNRVDALVAGLLVVLAVVLRAMSSDRLPMNSAHADFTYLMYLAEWARMGFWETTQVVLIYLPGVPILLQMVYWLVGPSLDAAFWMTTLFGAMTVVPVYLLAKHLSGSTWAGIFAGIVMAVYPSSIFFSNGLNLVTPAGFLLSANLLHFVGLVQRRTRLRLLLYLLSLVLVLYSRGDLVGLVAALILMKAVVVWRAGLLRWLLGQWPLLLAAMLALLPLAHEIMTAMWRSSGDVAGYGGLAVQALGAAAVWLSVLALWNRVLRFKGVGLVTCVLVGAAAGALVWRILSWFSWNALMISPMVHDRYPNVSIYANGDVFGLFDDRLFLAFVAQPALFPLVLVPFWLLSLLPGRQEGRWQFPWPAALLFSVPFVLRWVTSGQSTGVIIAEPARYLIPVAGVVAVSVALGAEQVRRLLEPCKRVQLAVSVALLLVLLSPIVTHARFYTDTRHNPQNDFLFTRAALGLVETGATVLVPDHCVYDADSGKTIRVDSVVNRTSHLMASLPWVLGRDVKVTGMSNADRDPALADATVYVLSNLDCYHVPRWHLVHPFCQMVQERFRERLVRSVTVPNRRYSGVGIHYLGPVGDRLNLGLYRLAPDDIREFQRFVRDRHDLVGCLPGGIERSD